MNSFARKRLPNSATGSTVPTRTLTNLDSVGDLGFSRYGSLVNGLARVVAMTNTVVGLAVLVTAASVQDSAAGRTLLEQAATYHPTLRKVWVDGGYRKHFIEHAAALGIDLEIVQRTPGTRRFTQIPKGWAVERTYGWLMYHRRLARDYKTHPHLMARRLTAEATPNWRGTWPGTKHESPDQTLSQTSATSSLRLVSVSSGRRFRLLAGRVRVVVRVRFSFGNAVLSSAWPVSLN